MYQNLKNKKKLYILYTLCTWIKNLKQSKAINSDYDRENTNNLKKKKKVYKHTRYSINLNSKLIYRVLNTVEPLPLLFIESYMVIFVMALTHL